MTWSPATSVNIARQWVGFHEGPANQNPFSQWQYGGAYNPWCDSFVCYTAFQAGYRFPTYSGSGIKGDFNVGSHHAHAVRQGIWRSTYGYHAQPGDLVVLSFGIPDQHIEMVLSDAGGNVATIGGNTGDVVAYRLRYRSNIVGFIALTQDQRQVPDRPAQPKEIKAMGMAGAVTVPGAHGQTKAPWLGRMPQVVAMNNPNGSADFLGIHGTELVGGVSAYGMSIVHIAKGVRLNKPLHTCELQLDKSSNWNGTVVATADDFGTFVVKVNKVHYL